MIFSCLVLLMPLLHLFLSTLMDIISTLKSYNVSKSSHVFFSLFSASKLYLNQMELNQYMTGLDFEIGYEYVYVVHLYLFVCFFVSLQPIICAFALVGYFIMYWTQKWSLFNRMRRPIPGNDLINTALGQLIFLGPIVYSLGSLTWSNFFPEGTPKYAIVPNLIALGISVFMFIFPLSLIFLACLKDKQ